MTTRSPRNLARAFNCACRQAVEQERQYWMGPVLVVMGHEHIENTPKVDFGGRISAHRLNMHKKKIVLPAPAFGRRMPT